MAISVTAPIQRAWDRMIVILFKPFALGKWFGLGFCFFLAYLGRNGGGGGFNFPMGGGGQGGGTGGTGSPGGVGGQSGGAGGTGIPGGVGGQSGSTGGQSGGVGTSTPDPNLNPVIQDLYQWFLQNLQIVVLVVAAVVAFSLTIWLLVLWLRSRGLFMMIDGLALNSGAVKDPWCRYKAAGNSLFWFSVVLQIIATVLMLLSIAAAVWIAWPDIAGQTFGTPAIWGIIVLVIALPLIGVNFFIIDMLLTDFIAPTMYIHDVRVCAAWRLWYGEIFKGHFWLLTLFYLMKLVLSMAAGTAMVLATCLTCCVAALPYIGTVILLPALVFMRCYTLYFLEQFGEPWRMFVYSTGEMPCVSCGYDLRGNPEAMECPECGGMTPTGLDAQWVP